MRSILIVLVVLLKWRSDLGAIANVMMKERILGKITVTNFRRVL